MTILDKLKEIWNIANGKPTAYRVRKNEMST